jgi:hypothetical protein
MLCARTFASRANIVRRAEVVPLSKREPKESQGTHTIGAQRIKHLTISPITAAGRAATGSCTGSSSQGPLGINPAWLVGLSNGHGWRPASAQYRAGAGQGHGRLRGGSAVCLLR